MTKLEEARRELNLRARHAFKRADADIYMFINELERFIEAKIDVETARLTGVRKPSRKGTENV